MLRTAMGPAVTAWLEDPAVVEVMLNPDGRLWIDRLAEGLADTGKRLSAADGERIVRLVAHHVGAEVHPGSPRVSAELPETGERFEGLIPPIVAAPAFAIRKPAVAIFTLKDYASVGIMTAEQAEILRDAVAWRCNVLVAGGTSTGKTTLVNALLAEVAWTADRIVLIEDTRELQCKAPNLVALRTKDGVASLSDLVRSSLRLRPDRIPIGEVRGAEALDLLKAWGTGHPGGIGTIHAGSAIGALRRLEQLIQEAVVTVPRALIAETINTIVVLPGRGAERKLVELAVVKGLQPGGDWVALRIGTCERLIDLVDVVGDTLGLIEKLLSAHDRLVDRLQGGIRQARQVFHLIEQHLGLVLKASDLVVDLLQGAGGLQHVLGVVGGVIDDRLPCSRPRSERQSHTDQNAPDAQVGHELVSLDAPAGSGAAAGASNSTAQSMPLWRSQPAAKPARPWVASTSAMAA
jgi:type IV secretion system protein TrbB